VIPAARVFDASSGFARGAAAVNHQAHQEHQEIEEPTAMAFGCSRFCCGFAASFDLLVSLVFLVIKSALVAGFGAFPPLTPALSAPRGAEREILAALPVYDPRCHKEGSG
jgi:hypothetical protein